MSPEIAVPMMVFGLPVAIVFVTRYFNFREKQLAAQVAAQRLPAPSDGAALPSVSKQRELEARIENLESILIALDSELEARLHAKRAPSPLPPTERAALPSHSPTPSDK
jgi:hypothetical protein